MSFTRAQRIAWLKEEAKKRILLLDGSWGVMVRRSIPIGSGESRY